MTMAYTLPAIPYHWGLRVMMAFYIFKAVGSTATASVNVLNAITPATRQYSYETVAINSCSGSDYVHFNIDDTFSH